MSIKSAHLQNFTAFENLEVEFSKGINVVIGTNGTGKTHLLKAMYGVSVEVNEESSRKFDIASNYFLVSPKQLKKDPHKQTSVKVTLANHTNSSYEIPNTNETHEDKMIYGIGFKTKPIFIPAKEMLSHSKVFSAVQQI